MNYSALATLIAWTFPTKDDRGKFRAFCRELDARKNTRIIHERYSEKIQRL